MSEPVPSVKQATGAKVSIVSSCIIRSICSDDAEKQETHYWEMTENSKIKGIRNTLYPRFIQPGVHYVFVAVAANAVYY